MLRPATAAHSRIDVALPDIESLGRPARDLVARGGLSGREWNCTGFTGSVLVLAGDVELLQLLGGPPVRQRPPVYGAIEVNFPFREHHIRVRLGAVA